MFVFHLLKFYVPPQEKHRLACRRTFKPDRNLKRIGQVIVDDIGLRISRL